MTAVSKLNKGSIRSVGDLVRAYKGAQNLSYAERLAEFLDMAAECLPKRFVDRRICAKIAFSQKRTPGEDSDWVKRKLPNIMDQTKKILSRKYERDLWSDRIDGIRATVDSQDIVVTVHRAKRSRVISAINSLERTDALVDANELTGPVKRELLKARKAHQALTDYKSHIPQLPPAKIVVADK